MAAAVVQGGGNSRAPRHLAHARRGLRPARHQRGGDLMRNSGHRTPRDQLYFVSPMHTWSLRPFCSCPGFFSRRRSLPPSRPTWCHLRHHDRDALLISPALTMRLLSEEQRTGPRSSCSPLPCERSRSSPANTSGHCAAVAILVPTWSICCCSHPRNPDYGPVVSGYSAPSWSAPRSCHRPVRLLAEPEPIVAAVLASPSRSCSGCCSRPTPSPPALRRLLTFLSLSAQFDSFSRGLIRPRRSCICSPSSSPSCSSTTRVLESADGARPRPQPRLGGHSACHGDRRRLHRRGSHARLRRPPGERRHPRAGLGLPPRPSCRASKSGLPGRPTDPIRLKRC